MFSKRSSLKYPHGKIPILKGLWEVFEDPVRFFLMKLVLNFKICELSL